MKADAGVCSSHLPHQVHPCTERSTHFCTLRYFHMHLLLSDSFWAPLIIVACMASGVAYVVL